MTVNVRFFASLRQAAGCESVDLAAKKVGEAIAGLKRHFNDNPEFLKLLKISNCILNGNNVAFLKGTRTPLSDGDQLALFPPLGGG